MKYLVGAMMMTVLSCSAAYAEEKPYYTYGDGKNVLIEKCLEAYDKGYTVRSVDEDNSFSNRGTFTADKYWSHRYALLGDRVYQLTLWTGSRYNFYGFKGKIKCVEYKTTLVE